jgi:hypothetical protein
MLPPQTEGMTAVILLSTLYLTTAFPTIPIRPMSAAKHEFSLPCVNTRLSLPAFMCSECLDDWNIGKYAVLRSVRTLTRYGQGQSTQLLAVAVERVQFSSRLYKPTSDDNDS